VLPPMLPGGLPVKIGPTLPARGAADVLRGRSTPGRFAPRSRPVTRGALPARGAAGQDRPHAPGRLPTCRRSTTVADVLRGRSTPGRFAPRSRPTLPAPRSRPVVLPARHSGSLAGPCCPRCCPAACPARAAPGRHWGTVARCARRLAGQDRPHAPGPSGCIGRDAGSLCDVAAKPCGWSRLWRFCRMRGCPALDS
jgi:hypothetical protein